ncbi:MAG TPA: alpha/beta hydrolase [Streptosporangiaceae bacterium]|nr:alpha/beta hydrolase [Streptosporangiaceae bacterium]
MTAGEAWVPPPTHELTVTGGRVVRYCCYGSQAGLPVVSLAGTPGTRWERPGVVSAIGQQGLRVVVPDRPGYGGSDRQPGRTVADVAADVAAVASAQGWALFAVTGFSGGGPHALACAALLTGRVTCCAAVATPVPPGADLFADRAPGQAEDFHLALRGEQALRPYLQDRASNALAQLETGGPDQALVPGEPADDQGRAARIRAACLGLDGWIDDVIALAHPWGFDLGSIEVPVSIWSGATDTRVPRRHTDWLLAQLPTAQGYEHPDGHDPSDTSYRSIFGWIAAASSA